LQYFSSAAIQLVRQSLVGKGKPKYPSLFEITTSGAGKWDQWVNVAILFETWEQQNCYGLQRQTHFPLLALSVNYCLPAGEMLGLG
jgi:hypothetical protein